MEERFETFTVLIGQISRSIYKLKTMEMAGYDLRSSHVSCLYYLYKMKSLTAKELCDICAEDKANISRAVKYLEDNGYLRCESKRVKRYQSPLILTEKGEEIGERIAFRIDRILSRAGDGVSEEDRRIMYRSLAVIRENLSKLCETYEEDGEPSQHSVR
jgi:DNA-binding MarR family transcriptional regulator